jgi:phenylacetate-CoA ligase
LYPALFRRFILPVSERALGLPTVKHFNQLMESQWWPLDRLSILQDRKLAETLLHARRTIPHFRDLLARYPESVVEAEPRTVCGELPLLFKEIVRREFPARIVSEAFSKGDYKETATAGSTGKPLLYVVSRDAYAAWWAHHFRAFEAAGYRLGDRIVYVAAIRELTAQRRIRDFLMRQVQLDAYQTSDKLIEAYLAKIRRYRPRIIRGYPEMLFLLAAAAESRRIRDIRPVSIITNSNKLHEFQRRRIQEVFQAPVFDYYSCPESGAFAFECDRHNGYHLALEHGFVEIVDDARRLAGAGARGTGPAGDLRGQSSSTGTGNGGTSEAEGSHSAPPGPVTGGVVSTNLDNRAMGFIKYVTGDFATASVDPNGLGRKCACGRGLPLIDAVEGRAHSLIVTKDGRYLHGVLFEGMTLHTETFKDLGQWVDRVQFVQETEDLVVLNVVKSREVAAPALEEGTLAKAVAETKRLLGPGMDVEVRFVDRIQHPPSGKRQLVVSKVLPDRLRPREETRD